LPAQRGRKSLIIHHKSSTMGAAILNIVIVDVDLIVDPRR
jgi:hypothetical protein